MNHPPESLGAWDASEAASARMAGDADAQAYPPYYASLVAALRRLDALLESLLKTALERGGVAEAALRGLYVSPEEALRLLHRGPCAPCGVAVGAGLELATASPLDALGGRYGLSSFELDMVLIALAPELDLRYERIYGFLQDDATRRRATVDLALDLRSSSTPEKIARLEHFLPGAPLIRQGVLRLVPDAGQPDAPLLAHTLRLDPQILAMLLGHAGADARLMPFCRLIAPAIGLDGLALDDGTVRALAETTRRAHEAGESFRLWFHGRDDTLKADAALAVAGALGQTLLHVDVGRMAASGATAVTLLPLVFREAENTNAVVYLFLDQTGEMRLPRTHDDLMNAIRAYDGRIVFGAQRPWRPSACGADDVIDVPFGMPDFAMRKRLWQGALDASGLTLEADALDTLCAGFRLSGEEISRATRLARANARWRTASGDGGDGAGDPRPREYFAAARAQCGHELDDLAHKIRPRQTWSGIALPDDVMAQLREICNHANARPKVLDDWGFERMLSHGKGLNALFTGAPGTGKSMAAEVIAGELQQDVYRIDLSRVVSKYIGETEKNLDGVFTAAHGANAILLFDEADALFGKRSEVKDAHDRYANIEVGYLLTKMEDYEGIAILATNLRRSMDDAFVRRMQHVVEFPFPDETLRRRIWQLTFSPQAPLGDDVDFDRLARDVKLAGGHIRNIVLAAAFLAASADGVIHMEHIARAVRREHQKLGLRWEERQLIDPDPSALRETERRAPEST
ncbi:ATP-binding protein [Caballeronia novacaledonica]|uniref:AAA family ATPase n=1 Tax=Caballeronia novacaledonica TaxID=1544861 RepID=A0AA37MU59_9BURK|nr:ATP-binding protein [Caballeronia novacaledonica]GJH28932.1 AAA family ATPase [Caballeronia novacaledonica]